MYGHPQPITTMPNQMLAGGGDDDEVTAVGVESMDNPLIHYDHTLDDAGCGGVVDDVTQDSVYVHGGSDLSVQCTDDSSQLALTFRGQVYVFDDVTPDKVQAVLLLLGCELSSAAQGGDMASQSQRGVVDFPARCSEPHRAASLNRFRQKRKERCFDKKVRYSVRQEVALRMQRNKGQFTSSNKSEGSCGWSTVQESGQDDNPAETSCTHCGISSKSTPMMRRGPLGPRSLCNACGLFWANRGTLRDISKRSQDNSPTPVEQGGDEANDSDCRTESDIHTHTNLVTYPNGDSSTLITEHQGTRMVKSNGSPIVLCKEQFSPIDFYMERFSP